MTEDKEPPAPAPSTCSTAETSAEELSVAPAPSASAEAEPSTKEPSAAPALSAGAEAEPSTQEPPAPTPQVPVPSTPSAKPKAKRAGASPEETLARIRALNAKMGKKPTSDDAAATPLAKEPSAPTPQVPAAAPPSEEAKPLGSSAEEPPASSPQAPAPAPAPAKAKQLGASPEDTLARIRALNAAKRKPPAAEKAPPPQEPPSTVPPVPTTAAPSAKAKPKGPDTKEPRAPAPPVPAPRAKGAPLSMSTSAAPGGGMEGSLDRLLKQTALVGDAHLPKDTAVWLMALGCRGDVAPFVPISIALRDAGYRVLVCTGGSCTGLFAPHGVPTLAWDQPLWKWSEATQSFFRSKASLDSPGVDRRQDDLDDIFLHVMLQKVEYCHWKVMKAFKAGNDAEFESMAHTEEYLDQMVGSRTWEYEDVWAVHRALVDEYTFHEAARLNVTPETLKTSRERARRELMEYIKMRAASVNVLPLHLLQTLHNHIKGFLYKLISNWRTRPHTSKDAITERFKELFAWAVDKQPDQWLDGEGGILSKFPHEFSLNDFDILNSMDQHSAHLHVQNLLMQIEATPSEEDLPKILLPNQAARHLAALVSERANCRVLTTIADVAPLQSDFVFLIYRLLLDRERQSKLDTSPFGDFGPANMIEELRNPDLNILCASPTMQQDFYLPKELSKDEEWVKRWKSHALGPFLLDTERQLQCENPLLYGNASTRQQLEDFVGMGEPPVCVHWGAQTHANPVEFLAATVGGLRLAKQRGIIISRWTRLSPELAARLERDDEKYFKEEVLLLKAAPHSWLFPKCSCVVNYGGRGAFATALCTAAPFVLVPVSNEGTRAPLLRAMRSHKSVHSHKELLPALTAKNLAESLRHVLSNEKLKAAAEAVRSESLAWPGVAEVPRLVQKSLKETMDSVVERQAQALTGPWMEGEYDAFDPEGEHVGKVEVHSGRIEKVDGSVAWLRAGLFKITPKADPSKPWLPVPAETKFDVEVYNFDSGIRHAVISDDGQLWRYEDGSKMIYRAMVPKACQCVVT